jgi:hypothetical protein
MCIKALVLLVAMLLPALSAASGAGATGPLEILAARLVLEGGGQTLEMEWPVVAGGTDDGAIAAMNEAMSWENVTGEPFEQTMITYSEIQRGYTGAAFDVNFNRGGILDITIIVDYVGAYPSTFLYWFNFDARTGDPLLPSDLFLESEVDGLVALLDSELQDNVQAAIEVYCSSPEEASDMYGDPHFTADYLGRFSIMQDGIEFHYDFEFPHAYLAAEPEEDLMVSWEDLAPFLDPEGPLSGPDIR